MFLATQNEIGQRPSAVDLAGPGIGELAARTRLSDRPCARPHQFSISAAELPDQLSLAFTFGQQIFNGYSDPGQPRVAAEQFSVSFGFSCDAILFVPLSPEYCRAL